MVGIVASRQAIAYIDGFNLYHGSDVNLACHLVWDACHGEMELAAVVSNDSDLQTAVSMAESTGVEVATVNPHLHRKQPQSLHGASTRRLTRGRLRKNRLPDPVVDGNGRKICCPQEWS